MVNKIKSIKNRFSLVLMLIILIIFILSNISDLETSDENLNNINNSAVVLRYAGRELKDLNEIKQVSRKLTLTKEFESLNLQVKR